MLVVRFPESNQTKMPKCVDLTEGTIWQWFISFGLWKSMKTFGIMEANECRIMEIKSGLHLTSLSSGICICCRPLSSLNTKAQNVTDPNVQQTKTHEQVTVQFFTELTGKCQLFLRFGRKISTT